MLGCGWGLMVLWFHGWGYKQLQKASHIHIICIQSVLAPWYAVDGQIGAPFHCYTSASGGEFLESWGVGEAKWYCGVMVESTNSFRRHPTSISYIQSVLAPWYAVDGHMGAPLHCNTCVGGGEFLESWGVGEAKWCCGVMVENTNSFRRHPTSISYGYKVF